MRKPYYAIFLLLIIAGSFWAGTRYSHLPVNKAASAGGRKILYYQDPMHPSYKSDKPGIAPDCGMQLEPVYADGQPTTQDSENDTASIPAGAIQIGPERQQVMGVHVESVEKAAGNHELRTVGRITADENRIYRLLTGVDGWIRELYGGTTGSVVQKGDLLATIYNREFLTAEQALFYALNAMDRFKKEGMDSPEQVAATTAQIKAAEDNLRVMGMDDIQIQEISQTRKSVREIAIRAPVTGLVLARNVFPGLRFERSTELYRFVDLSHVWVLADLFENEAQYFRPRATASVTIPHQNKTFAARVSDVPPQFDPNTRTLKVRLEVENPGFALRPDMFVDVTLPVTLPEAVSVPTDAVLDSGLHKRVFVDHGNGFFEPRIVETGWHFGDRIEIVKGLMPGERIVVSGAFLVDSESRMKAAVAGITGEPAKDPTCGMEVDQSKAKAAGLIVQYGGRTYYFCSDDCKAKFQKDAAKYASK